MSRRPLPIMLPNHDRYVRAAGLRPEVRGLAQQLADRGVNHLCDALAAALNDPYQAGWLAAAASNEALDFWQFHLTPEVDAIYQSWSDSNDMLQLLSTGHQLLALLAALLEILPGTKD